MAKFQTYTGRVCNGQPVVSEAVALPEGAELLITLLSESFPTEAAEINQSAMLSNRQAQRAAFEEFFSAMAEIDDEPLDDEFDLILNNRVNISRELDL